MEPRLFRVVVAALLGGFVLHRGYYTRRHGQPPPTPHACATSTASGRAANLLGGAASVVTALYLFVPRAVAWAALPLPRWARWLGLGQALASMALLQWAQQTLGRNWSDAPRLLPDHALIASGPYRWVRHPIYAAFLGYFGGLALVASNWLLGGLWLGMTGIEVAARMRIEEALLSKRFGDRYHAYQQRTGRLLPCRASGK